MASNPRPQARYGDLPDEALIGLRRVLELVPVCETLWWRGCQDGRFPEPVYLPGVRRALWRLGDVRALIAQGTRAAAPRSESATA